LPGSALSSSALRQYVLPFSGSTVDHGNLVGLGIGANAAAKAASQAHPVVVVEGLVGTG